MNGISGTKTFMKYINLYFIMFVYFNITAIYVFFFGGGIKQNIRKFCFYTTVYSALSFQFEMMNIF